MDLGKPQRIIEIPCPQPEPLREPIGPVPHEPSPMQPATPAAP